MANYTAADINERADLLVGCAGIRVVRSDVWYRKAYDGL